MKRTATLLAIAVAVLGLETGDADAQRKARAADKKEASKEPAKREASEKSQPVSVDADRMERFGKESLIVFSGNVVAKQNGSVQYADRLEVYLDERGKHIVRTVSTGSVKIITRDCRTGTAKRAEYYDLEQRFVLTGGARVWQDDNVVTGETITIFLAQDKSVVEGGKQDRVKLIFHPKDAQKDVAKAPCGA